MIPSKRRRLNKVRVTLAALALALIAGLPILWFVFSRIGSHNQSQVSKGPLRLVSSKCGEPQTQRRVFKYSVVAGGVQSAAELSEAAERDPVVHDHYHGIDLNKVKELRLGNDMRAYVSYRVKDKVYWTQKKIQLRKGELVLTDGTNLVRSRCGNRISISRIVSSPGSEPEEPQFDLEEPKEPALDVSVVPVAAVIVSPFTSALKDASRVETTFTPPLAVSRAVLPSYPAPSRDVLPLLIPIAAVAEASIAGGSSNPGATIVRPSGAPVSAPPANGLPAGGSPVGGPPVDGPPVGGPPVGGPPVGGPPVGGSPVGGPPVGGPPVGGPPVGGPPVGGPPVGGPPVSGPPVGGSPVGGSPVGGSPVGGSPVGGPPVGGPPVVVPPVTKPPVGGRPVTVAPEPSSYVCLLAIGFGWLLIRSRRNRFKGAQQTRTPFTGRTELT